MLNVDDILDKGLEAEEALTENERLIYAVAYLESIADMEGWDHYFTYDMKWYPLLIDLLRRAGDFRSLGIVNDYKKHFDELGVGFEAKEIDFFLCEASDDYFDTCPDWRELFSDMSEQRWRLIAAYFKNIGVNVKT